MVPRSKASKRYVGSDMIRGVGVPVILLPGEPDVDIESRTIDREVSVRVRIVPSAIILAALAQAAQAQATQAAAPSMPPDQIVAFAKVHAAIAELRDSTQAQLALPRNNKIDVQQQLRDDLQKKIAEALHHGGMSDEEYRQKIFIISTDGA